MAKVRCKETRADSFFGNFLYERKVSKNHFLRKLNEVVDWERFTRKLLVLSCNNARYMIDSWHGKSMRDSS